VFSSYLYFKNIF